jgi:hypothetical protein
MTPPEMTLAPDVPEKTEEKPKLSVKEFLKTYRSLGLPGAKRFRRRTRLEEAKTRHDIDVAMNTRLVQLITKYKKAFEELKKETNWAVHTDYVLGKDEKQEEVMRVEWVGESDPLTIIRDAEKA